VRSEQEEGTPLANFMRICYYLFMNDNEAPKPNFYEALGVPRDAEPDAIKKAFRKSARENHPDVNPDPKVHEAFKLITEAWDTLSKPDSRREYDAKLALPSRNRSTYEPTDTSSNKEARRKMKEERQEKQRQEQEKNRQERNAAKAQEKKARKAGKSPQRDEEGDDLPKEYLDWKKKHEAEQRLLGQQMSEFYKKEARQSNEDWAAKQADERKKNEETTSAY
jgi:curved DNA-binding protein CbpA